MGYEETGYTESWIIPNASIKACNRGISQRNIRDNFLCVCTVRFSEIQVLEKQFGIIFGTL